MKLPKLIVADECVEYEIVLELIATPSSIPPSAQI